MFKILKGIWNLYRVQAINGEDVVLLTVLNSHMKDGKCRLTNEAIGEILGGVHWSSVAGRIGNLVRHKILIRGKVKLKSGKKVRVLRFGKAIS